MTDAARAKPAAQPRPPTGDAGREFVTPEGVDLRLRLGEVADRAAALVIDLLIMVLLLIAMTLLAGAVLWASKAEAPEVVGIIWLVGFFLLRNFYFTGFEL